MVFWVSFYSFSVLPFVVASSSNLQKLFWNVSITTHATCLTKFYRSYFEMRPLELMQLVWSNLQKLFWNASITTHATCLIKFTEVILKCIIRCNSCNLSDRIYRSYFWNASSVATHATCLIALMPYRNTLELQLHMVKKNREKFLSEKSITPEHVGWKHNPFHSWR
jgi:hypothetical protein